MKWEWETIWDTVRNSLEHDAIVWIGVGLILLLVFAASHNKTTPGWAYHKPRSYNRGKRMLRTERLKFVDNLAAHDFVDCVETRVYNEEITRSEATEVYRKFKRLFPLRDMFPSPHLLKEKIQKRLGTHTAPNLPGTAPKVRAKNLFDNSPKRVAL